jgi:hypothetical protein
MNMRVIKDISNQAGTLSDGQTIAKVRFSLTQWQEFVDDQIPGLRSATGTIQFEDAAKASLFFNSGGSSLLKGGGIEAKIIATTPTEFTVTGPITDLPNK